MNTREKPATKSTACPTATRRRRPSSGRVIPVRTPMYEGTSGRTQGERKLSRPAVKATMSPREAGSLTRETVLAGARLGDADKLHPVPAMLETVFIGQHRQHALEPLVGKLHHSAALLANQVL